MYGKECSIYKHVFEFISSMARNSSDMIKDGQIDFFIDSDIILKVELDLTQPLQNQHIR